MAIPVETLPFFLAATPFTQCRVLWSWLCSRPHLISPHPVVNLRLGGEPPLWIAAFASVSNAALAARRHRRSVNGLFVLVVARNVAPRPFHVAFSQCAS